MDNQISKNQLIEEISLIPENKHKELYDLIDEFRINLNQQKHKMKPFLLDTDIFYLFFRNHLKVVEHCNLYLQEYERLSFSLITYYEILSGLKYRDAQKQLEKFLAFSKLNQIIPLTEKSVKISAKIYADLRKKGTFAGNS
jgi:predicted nucleic acid-binding protein